MIYAVANQKGGVGKTTTVSALGAAFAERGARVLVVDLDPQAGLTITYGVNPNDLPQTVYQVMLEKMKMSDVAVRIADPPMTLVMREYSASFFGASRSNRSRASGVSEM